MTNDVLTLKQMIPELKTCMLGLQGNIETLKTTMQTSSESAKIDMAERFSQFDAKLGSLNDDLKCLSDSSIGRLKIDGMASVTSDASENSPIELPLASNIAYSREKGNEKQTFTMPTCAVDGFCVTVYVAKSPAGCIFISGKNLMLPEGRMVRIEDKGVASFSHSKALGWVPMSMSKSKFVLAYDMPDGFVRI